MSRYVGLLEEIYSQKHPDRSIIVELLKLDRARAEDIFLFAERLRSAFMGEGILVRGIVEFSNICRNECLYCGLNKNNTSLKRYRLSMPEVLQAARQVASNGIKTIVLQSGEDDGLDAAWLYELICRIKSDYNIAVTLCVGERSFEEYKLWREAGADRYLLKIETTDKALYERLHPGMSFDNRIRCLMQLKELGYQLGSGNIIGLKDQSLESIAGDILFFKEMNLDMVGIGPFIPHPQTRLSSELQGEVFLTLKTIALTRIVTKTAHIPATTALGSLEADYRIAALKSGANVLMPNFTPAGVKKLYDLYPHRRCLDDSGSICVKCMDNFVKPINRHLDFSRGDSLKKEDEAYV
ncbi:MAG: [FeFe] hydrogenase H-cluster radical SAM maturase HydE [Candidatus Omnitrophota bacterium]|jgi:biotin synthase|nr:MAG: [FeFe] hydrogenase H-cluster radical SAM maturase HydE [Candidatus Omnitrophota bacterium]